MLKQLKPILEIQEFDMKMIRLMRLKIERLKELNKLQKVKADLKQQMTAKKNDVMALKLTIKHLEGELEEVVGNIKKLEARQGQVKKVEEFNALTHETSSAEKDRHNKELKLSDLYDKLGDEESLCTNLEQSLAQTEENSRALENEIIEGVKEINIEGSELKKERDGLVDGTDEEVFTIYEKLLRNKKDRVIVPIENRCCSGCHIQLTAQHENMVRRGERIIFCEHCSRIHYWPESEVLEGSAVATSKRRRRKTKV